MEYFVWDIDPTFFSYGVVKVHWYGLLFAIAFISSYLLMFWIYHREGRNTDDVDDLLWYMAIGTIAGARLGHCLFYNPEYYFSHPLKILAIWEGGLASHGATIGIILGLYLFQFRVKESFVWFLDRIALVCALGAAFIRTGNFFNSEILGIPTLVSWAVIFKRVDFLPRHPVQLYEASSYLLVFVLLLYLYKKRARPGVIFATFLVTVFISRFFLEFIKTEQASYSNDLFLSTGQFLSIPFILMGMIFLIFPFNDKQPPSSRIR
jgi:prolipoprotein diacylglyceryl transferase